MTTVDQKFGEWTLKFDVVYDYEEDLITFSLNRGGKFIPFNIVFNPCGESDQLIVHLNVAKMVERSEAKSAKRSFASKYLLF